MGGSAASLSRRSIGMYSRKGALEGVGRSNTGERDTSEGDKSVCECAAGGCGDGDVRLGSFPASCMSRSYSGLRLETRCDVPVAGIIL